LQRHPHGEVICDGCGPGHFPQIQLYVFMKLQEVREDKRTRGEHLRISSHSIDIIFQSSSSSMYRRPIAFKDGEEAVYNLSVIAEIVGRQVSNLHLVSSAHHLMLGLTDRLKLNT